MISRRHTLLLTLLALLVPLPAFALNGGGTQPAGPVEISVSASLGDCGLAETQIVCQINASWSAVEHADYYTLSVTRSDGSVVDYGQSAGTGTSLWVPYVGSGTYSVEVAAWGTPPDADRAHVIARETSVSSSRMTRPALDARRNASAGEDGRQPGTAPGGAEVEGPDTGAAGEEPGEPTAEEPACEEPDAERDPDDAPRHEDGSDGAGEVQPETADVSAETQAALAAEAELPDTIVCP